MRLLQRVLACLNQTTNPQQKLLTHLLGLLLMLPGHATLRHLSRYRPYHDRTFSRWSARDFAFVSRNQAAIPAVVPAEHAQALVMDARFGPTSGKQPYGLDRCWNGSQSRTESGWDISAVAWLDITGHCAYCLRVAQTPPTGAGTEPAATRSDVYRDQLTRLVLAHDLGHLHSVMTDGDSSKQQFLHGVRALGRHQIGTRRAAATLRSLYTGPKRPGPGRPTRYDGTGAWNELARVEPVDPADDPMVLSPLARKHRQCQCARRVVVVVDTHSKRRTVLFSPEVDLEALTLYRYDKARFQIACLFRDAKPFTGLTNCPARSQANLDLHCKARLPAGTRAKRAARQQNGPARASCSMASLTRRAFKPHLIARLSDY